AVASWTGPHGEHALRQVARAPGIHHLPTVIRWPNARSTASQNDRQAGYSAGVIRTFLNASEVFTVTFPDPSSTPIENRPTGVWTGAAVGGRVTFTRGGGWIVHSSAGWVSARRLMSSERFESEA